MSTSHTHHKPADAAVSGNDKTATLQEVFSSIQGEGPHVGRRQVFVRFAHCHLKCAYCDTPMTSASGQCEVETLPGSGEKTLQSNPMTPEALIRVIEPLLETARHHSVSFTGGEPLLYHGFLKQVLPAVRRHVSTYLETSGTQADFLTEILPWTDIIAMDFKLPSATGETARYEEHALFYEAARQNPATELFIKLIFNERLTDDEIAAVREAIPNPDVPVFLQPVTSLADRRVHVPPDVILRTEAALSRYYRDVRVIPQTHKLMNVL